MGSYIRRFLFDPGDAILLNIESVNILDLTPPSSITGIGSGTAIIVGEFENGPFLQTTEISSATDLQQTFGTLGFTYGGTPSNYPCAVSRKADNAIFPEFWNGNGFVQLSGKQFARLLICRVDTSVGQVQFSRLAFIQGAANFRYQLSAGQVLSLDVGAGFLSATFTATAAVRTAAAGTYPTTFAGGETLTLGYDGAPNFTVTFLAADQSLAQVVARINAYAGFAFADSTGGQLRLTGLQKGNGGQVRVVAASAGGVLTQLGLTVATTAGTGNVANVAAVTPAEIKVVVEAAVSGSLVEVSSSGNLRVSNTTSAGYVTLGAATTATGLGFAVGSFATSSGQAILVSGAGTYNTTFVGGETLVLNVDGVQFTAAFVSGDQTLAQVVTRLNTAAGKVVAAAVDATHLQLFGSKPGGNVTVLSATGAASPLTILGLAVGSTTGVLPAQGSLPAGTVVQVPNGQIYVTMQDIVFQGGQVLISDVVQAAQTGPWSVKIRPAVDDGTGLGTGAGTITSVSNPPDIGAFSVNNLQVVTAALTEGAIDAAYAAALTGPTIDINNVSKQANLIWSARQSNTVRRQLRTNAVTASANGLFGRMAAIRTPLNTSRAVALSTTAEPGVGATRDQRVIFCYPQANTFVPMIATRGLSGGAGFTADGNVDVGADGFMVSICSQLPPEENPGQDTPFATAVNSVETGANAQGFTIVDYINFKAGGVAALRIDDGVATFQSGVTSVDPLVNPSLVRISRRRMADFIQDSVALASKGFGKRLSTVARRNALRSEIRQFLRGLLSPNNPAAQRIGGFKVTDKAINTTESLGNGLYRIIVNVQTLASLDSIVIQATIGEQVTDVDEVLPQAA